MADRSSSSAVWEAVTAHLASGDVAHVIYGSVIGLALVVALQLHPPGAGQTAAAIAGTAVAVGLAHLYSEYLGTEARKRRHVGAGELRRITVESLAVSFGAAVPALFFAVAALGWMAEDTAFALAKWTGLGLICVYGFAAARLAGDGILEALLRALVAGSIGALLIALKALLH
jgi:hypothetical protein